MSIKYFSALFVFGFLFNPLTCDSLKAHDLDFQKSKRKFIKEEDKVNYNILSTKNTQTLFEDSFYKNGYTYKESMRFENQFFDLLGISLKSKGTHFSFPEKRIEKDNFLLWEDYTKYFAKQLNLFPKITNDIDNGFSFSLGDK